MATWAMGKITRPALRQAFGYLQDKHPDSSITKQVARVATSLDPLAPSEEPPLQQAPGSNATAAGIRPEEGEEGSSTVSRTLRARTQRAVQGRAQTYAFGKIQSVVWQQICMPLTAVLWALSLLLAWWEQHAETRARVVKEQSQHDRDVARIAAAIKARPASKALALKPDGNHVPHVMRAPDSKSGGGLVATLTSTSSTSASSGPARPRQMHLLDLSRLTRVLSIDPDAQTCVVEAGCTFRDLLRATTQHRLMPAVVPPFPEQTVGGCFSGGAISSASFSAGSFASTVIEAEVLLGNGDVMVAARDGAHSELFHALPGSYHTVATVTSLKLQLTRAPRYVHMKYENFNSVERATARLQTLLTDRRSTGSVIGVEGLVFSPTNVTLCICVGIDSIDTGRHKVVSLVHWWDQHYIDYVRGISTLFQSRSMRRLPEKDCIPLTDYLFRFEQSSFCLADFVFHLLPWPLTGNTFISRLLVGWALRDKDVRGALQSDADLQQKMGRLRIMQDAHIPLAHVSRWVGWQLEAIGVTPLWLCPVLASPRDLLEASFQHAVSYGRSGGAAFHYVNVSCYGRPMSGEAVFDAEEVNEELVGQVYKAGGRCMLHAANWHSAELFAQMYDRGTYDLVRSKYAAADAYLHLFDKVAIPEKERAALREPFQEAERPLLHTFMNRILMHKVYLA